MAITDKNTPWDDHTGQEVEQFIKSTFDTKLGASYFDSQSSTLCFFASKDDLGRWVSEGMNLSSPLIVHQSVLSFSGMNSRILFDLSAMGDTRDFYFVQSKGEAEITLSFMSQQKAMTDTEWTTIHEDYRVSVFVDKGSTGTFGEAIVNSELVLDGNLFSVDVYKHLNTGSNRVRIVCVGESTGTRQEETFSAYMTSMYIKADNFDWATPIIEGNNISIGTFKIGGSISKKLYVKVEGDGYEHTYEQNIGTSVFENTSTSYTGVEFPNASNNQLDDSTRTDFTGVYSVKVWLESGSLRSDILEYQMIFVEKDDIGTVQLVCVNEVANPAMSGTTGRIFGYAVYNGGNMEGSVDISLSVGDEWSKAYKLNVETGDKKYLVDELAIPESVMGNILSISVTNGNTVSLTTPIDNTYSFPATVGYKFYMNAATRTNMDENRDKIINLADGTEIDAEWTKISFIGDAHHVDTDGNKCLYIPAGSKASIRTGLMSSITNNGKSIEMAFRINNAADFNESIISILENNIGLNIKARNVLLRYNGSEQNELAQSYNIKDEEFVHVVAVISPNYLGKGGVAQIYVNGLRKTAFSYTGSFSNSGTLDLGSENADLYMYKVRVYDTTLGWLDVIQNYENCLLNVEDKIAVDNRVKSVIDEANNISYEHCSASGKNTMVIELLDGATDIPSIFNQTSSKCNVAFNIRNLIKDEFDDEMYDLLGGNGEKWLMNQTVDGQGTTAMTYYRWNLRWKLDKTYNKRRITAKKNFASSMHSHKMGATRMFNELHEAICGKNELEGRVAVAQYPAYGFIKTTVDGVESYQFIGLYTVGADKGDDKTFGYDNETYENEIISLEGSDHNATGVGFDYPWIDYVDNNGVTKSTFRYDYARESLVTATTKPWEVAMAGQYGTDDASDEASIYTMLVENFKPAYDFTYNCSTHILGISETMDSVNGGNVDEWRKRVADDGKLYALLEFWSDGDYRLFYYNLDTKKYHYNGVNLLTQLGISANELSGLTIEAKNELFKQKRREMFMAALDNGEYWDLKDALFHDVFLEIIGATDNFKKNNYPYLCKKGGLWRRRQDDLDTIFDVNNQGYARKVYSILIGDMIGSGSVFEGEDSVFHTLMEECYRQERGAGLLDKPKMARMIFDAMAEKYPYGNTQEMLVGYIRSRFWDYAQYYFAESAYSNDASWSYDQAWVARKDGTYTNDVDPLQQSLGSHLEAERNWIELRMIFMSSLYNWGGFASGSASQGGVGALLFRNGVGSQYLFNITPAIDMNPTILEGDGSYKSAGHRVKAGETVSVAVEAPVEGGTQLYFKGADYVSDFGDLSQLKISENNPTFIVNAKRMRRLKLGGEKGTVPTDGLTQLNLESNPSLVELDVRNRTSLAGTIDLKGCPRIKNVLFEGTSIDGVNISEGSKIEELSLPETITRLSLVRLPYLTNEKFSYGTEGNELKYVNYLRVENCLNIDSFDMLRKVYANSDVLKYIRIVGFNKVGGTEQDMDMLYDLATAKNQFDDWKYRGISADGSEDDESLPVIKGVIVLSELAYESRINAINEIYSNLVQADDKFLAYEFEDELVNDIFRDTWGMKTKAEIGRITGIPSGTFNGSNIVKFNDFELFEGLDYDEVGDIFANCKLLEEIKIPRTLTFINSRWFLGCSSLRFLSLPPFLRNINSYGFFYGCTSLTEVVFEDYDKDISLRYGSAGSSYISTFKGTGLKRVYIGRNIKYMDGLTASTYGYSPFYNCQTLKHVEISGKCTSLPLHCFRNCSNLQTIISRLVTPPTLGSNSFTGTNSEVKIYVPEESVGKYKSASNWNVMAANFYPLSEYVEE